MIVRTEASCVPPLPRLVDLSASEAHLLCRGVRSRAKSQTGE